MPKQPRPRPQSAKKPSRLKKRPLIGALVCLALLAGIYVLFFAPVSAALPTLPLADVEPERLQVYLEAQEAHQLPWYVFAGIDHAEYGDAAPMPTAARTASIAARVSGAKQGNVSVSREENEFEYATLQRMLERYPRQDNAFIDRAIERMRALSRLSRALEYDFPLSGNCAFTDDPDLHAAPGLLGVAITSDEGAVLSASDGLVVKSGRDEQGGYVVSVLSPENLTLSYAHLGAVEPGVAEGTNVRKGARLGTLGSTDPEGHGSHLLFCMRDGAFTVNPEVFLRWWREH